MKPKSKIVKADTSHPSPPRRASVNGSTRRTLMTWALARVTTDELKRCKKDGTDIVELAQRGKTENNSLVLEVERLKKQVADLYEGNRRWREEAIAMHQLKRDVEAAMAKASKPSSSATAKGKP